MLYAYAVEDGGRMRLEWQVTAPDRPGGLALARATERSCWTDLVRPEDRGRVEERRGRLLAGSISIDEVALRPIEGRALRLRLYGRPEARDGRVVRVLGSAEVLAADGGAEPFRAEEIAARLERRHAAAPPVHEVRRGGLPPARLRRVLDHIEADPGGDTGLRRLAGIAGLSPSHFATAFRRSTGLPPHRYVLERRVERARELLLADPRLPLAEVAYALGFPSQAHFTTVFRRLVGATPGAYRKGW